jgi:acetylornithine deacetylase/succinyl-diaminopimelate desuccinylase-like protein
VIRAMRDRSGELPVSIRWIIEGEEEVLSPHFDEIVRSNVDALRADACLWEGMPARLADGRRALALGVKGALSVRVDVRSLNTDVHSMLAAVAPSAAWRLVEALSSLRDRAGTVRVAGFYDAVLDPTEAERRAIADESDSTERA